MTNEELTKYIEDKNTKRRFFIRQINQLGITIDDLSIVDFCDGLWIDKLKQPLFSKCGKITIECLVCGCKFDVAFSYYVRKKDENKNVCSYCSRSRNLKKLNKTIMGDIRTESWKNGRFSLLREQYSKRRIETNKTTQRNLILSLSEEKKKEIAIKKANTFHSRPKEEQKEINIKRNGWNYFTDEQKKEKTKFLGKVSKEFWDRLTKEEILERTKKNYHGSGYFKKETIGNIYVESSYEKKFLLEVLDNNLNIDRGPNIEYFDTYDNKVKIYFIDFVLNNYLIEVKSSYFWKLQIETNMCKRRAAEEYAKNNGYNGYLLFIFNNNKEITFDIIKNKIYT